MAEIELQAHLEGWLQLCISASNIGLWDWDLATNRVNFSREWKDQIGYAEDEISNSFEEWQSRVHPDDLETTLHKVRASLDSPHGCHYVEFRFRHKNGTYRWISAQAAVVRDAEGKPIRMLGCHIDLTERKQAEEELRESERRLNEAQRLARIGSWQSVIGRPLILSDQMYELFKLPRGEPITKDAALSVVHPEDRGASYSHIFENALQEGASDLQGEFRVVWPDGQVRTLSTSGEIRRDASGQMVGAVGTVQDVTERKLAEQALRASEERFRLQVTASSDVVYRMSPDWSEMRLLTGRDFIRDTLTPSRGWLQKYIHPDDQARVLAAIEAAIRNKSTFELEHRVIRVDGSLGWTFSRAIPMFDAAGEIVEWLGAASDITVRKEADEALRASEASYRSLFDNMLNCLCNVRLIFDGERVVDFEYLAVNRAFATLPGMPNIVGKRVTDISPHMRETDPEWFELLGRVARTGVPESREIWLEARRDWYSVAVYKQASDQIVFLFDIITKRKRAEESLQASERLLEESQRVAHLGSWAVELPGYQLTWSEEAYRVWGVSPQTFVPSFEAFLSLIHPDDVASMLEWSKACAAGESPADLEFRAIRSDGSFRILNGRGVLLRDEENRPVRMTGTIQDISERKRVEEEKAKLEAQFHQAQKMESVGRLAGGVAHDFNNLLTLINGYSSMILAELKAGDPLRDSVAEISRAGERAAGLTRQLLAFSRKQVLESRRLDVNRVVEDMRPMLERIVGEDIEVRIVLSAGRAAIQADPNQLEQVVMNLVVNARDAMPGQGRLLIETADLVRDIGYTRLHPEARVGRYVMLAVSDTGEGMDQETMKRIFEPFFTTKAIGKGTGLGLATVQGIVAQSGGYVEVYSEKGSGTTFKVYLPALTEEAADAPVPTAIQAQGGTETVLIVEDQAEVRKLAAAMLQRYGYRVIPAENADDALLFCERERIDLVLTDVVMPNVSGRELADRLEKLQPGVKVLFMSGYTGNVIEHHRVLEQDSHFIQKPFSPEELTTKVRSVLGPPASDEPSPPQGNPN